MITADSSKPGKMYESFFDTEDNVIESNISNATHDHHENPANIG
jgi:hypothetical protein